MATPRMSIQTLRILHALADDPYKQWYGLELARVAGLKSGTIYPALARLEHAGWLTSEWEEGDPSTLKRPLRRLYRLTGVGETQGRLALDAELAQIGARPRPVTTPGLQPRGTLA
jgi:PadR family transcriptional regulator PadR